MNNSKLKQEAIIIADNIISKNSVNIEMMQSFMGEKLFELNHSDFIATHDHWFSYKLFIEDIAFVFTNPDISSKLTKCNQEKAYTMLKALTNFFDSLANNEQFHLFLIAFASKTFYENITENIYKNLQVVLKE